MGKKSRRKKTKEPEKKSKSPIPWIIGAVLIVIVILVATGNLPFSGDEKEKGKSFNLTGKETRQVLDPSMFTGVVRAAYAAAKKYPELMNEVFCYCYCHEPPFNHKTLLSCFTEKHGVG